jgi:hypothetical protein
MELTVTEFLRNFSRLRLALLAGEVVIIKSRDGKFRLNLENPAADCLVGCLKGLLERADDDIDRPMSNALSWETRL